MKNTSRAMGGYMLAALFGATAGGIAVAALTRVIPEMMSRMIPAMMQNMMTQMGAEGCNPEEM